ncbi:MAG: DHH family phosphoesterase [Candidatus Anstonellales archaeon]
MHVNPLKRLYSSNVLLTFHSQGDLDAVASASALYFFLPKSTIFMQDSINAESRKLAESLGIKIERISEANLSNFSSIVLLDCNSRILVPNLKADKVDLIIDHHPPHQDLIPSTTSVIDPNSCATCEVLCSLIPQTKITKKIALCLLAGIVSDSAHFRSASNKTFQTVSRLLCKAGITYYELLEQIHTPTDISQRFEMLRAMQGVNFERKGNFLVVTAIVNSFEAHVASTLVYAGADFAFVAHKGKKQLRISARVSRAGMSVVDLSSIMSQVSAVFGGSGGGHPYAAGYDGDCPEKAEEILSFCKGRVLEKLQK